MYEWGRIWVVERLRLQIAERRMEIEADAATYPCNNANIVPNIVSVLPAQKTNIQRISVVSSAKSAGFRPPLNCVLLSTYYC